MNDQRALKIAITLIPGIGDINAKRLIAYCGGLEAVFRENKNNLDKIPGISDVLAKKIIKTIYSNDLWKRVEEELKFCDTYQIQILSYLDENYPYRLKHCEDGPVTIFTLGNIPFNAPQVLSVVGTRRATHYGRAFCDKIMQDFKNNNLNVLIVSGLAYGIDIAAHKSALDNGLPTVAVVAHGLDQIYPAEHKKIAAKMLDNGGLISEFLSKTPPDKGNFVKRNRIIAGMSDATLVVESKRDGGAMITAEIAFSYNRDVLALPGKISDTYSEGPNFLIKSNKAALVESAEDICKVLGWSFKVKNEPNNIPLVFEINEDEKKIIEILKDKGDITIDLIALAANMPVSKVSVLLLNMEFNGLIKPLPGKVYTLAIKL
ncbi:MAG: DNA-protecting protein DprA [Bacteroidales bacterium]|nr:DNA-protecting protein DprA [Bacteroidales bacterium]